MHSYSLRQRQLAQAPNDTVEGSPTSPTRIIQVISMQVESMTMGMLYKEERRDSCGIENYMVSRRVCGAEMSMHTKVK
jgi:hypothetical protein